MPNMFYIQEQRTEKCNSVSKMKTHRYYIFSVPSEKLKIKLIFYLVTEAQN